MLNSKMINEDRQAKISGYDEELKQAYEHYVAKVMEIAARARRRLIVPYLSLCNLEFTTGNGSWSVTAPSRIRRLANGDRDWRNYEYDLTDDLPDWLERLLQLEVEGTQGNPELALWMLDYTARKTKNRGD